MVPSPVPACSAASPPPGRWRTFSPASGPGPPAAVGSWRRWSFPRRWRSPASCFAPPSPWWPAGWSILHRKHREQLSPEQDTNGRLESRCKRQTSLSLAHTLKRCCALFSTPLQKENNPVDMFRFSLFNRLFLTLWLFFCFEIHSLHGVFYFENVFVTEFNFLSALRKHSKKIKYIFLRFIDS